MTITEKISISDIAIAWKRAVAKSKKENVNGYRLGQFFMNTYFSGEANPDIFYETNETTAWDMIINLLSERNLLA